MHWDSGMVRMDVLQGDQPLKGGDTEEMWTELFLPMTLVLRNRETGNEILCKIEEWRQYTQNLRRSDKLCIWWREDWRPRDIESDWSPSPYYFDLTVLGWIHSYFLLFLKLLEKCQALLVNIFFYKKSSLKLCLLPSSQVNHTWRLILSAWP